MRSSRTAGGQVSEHNGTRRAGEAAAFRARVDERLRNLEGEIGEVKARINGLLFFIAGVVIAQAVLRVVA